MTVRMFSNAAKRVTIDNYRSGNYTVHDLARHACCSVTTIKRVLEEAGVFKPVKRIKPAKTIKGTETETAKIMAICYRHKIDSQKLEALINEPSLSPDNVVAFLRNSNARQLAIILVAAGLATQLPTLPIPKDAQMPLIE